MAARSWLSDPDWTGPAMVTPVPGLSGRVPVSLSSRSRLVAVRPVAASPVVWTWTELSSPRTAAPPRSCSSLLRTLSMVYSLSTRVDYCMRPHICSYRVESQQNFPAICYCSGRRRDTTVWNGSRSVTGRSECSRINGFPCSRPCLGNAQTVHGVVCGCWVSYSCFPVEIPAEGRQILALEKYCSSITLAGADLEGGPAPAHPKIWPKYSHRLVFFIYVLTITNRKNS